MGGSLPFRIGHAGAKHRKRASDSAFCSIFLYRKAILTDAQPALPAVSTSPRPKAPL